MQWRSDHPGSSEDSVFVSVLFMNTQTHMLREHVCILCETACAHNHVHLPHCESLYSAGTCTQRKTQSGDETATRHPRSFTSSSESGVDSNQHPLHKKNPAPCINTASHSVSLSCQKSLLLQKKEQRFMRIYGGRKMALFAFAFNCGHLHLPSVRLKVHCCNLKKEVGAVDFDSNSASKFIPVVAVVL